MSLEIPECYRGQDIAHCGKCKRWKPKQDFCKNSRNASGVHGHCKACQKEWRFANRQKLIDNAIQWQRNNPERAIAAVQKWGKNNPEKVKLYKNKSNKKQWEKIKNNPELLEKDRAKKNEFAKRKQHLFPEINRDKHHKRKAREYKCEGSHTQEEWISLCAKYGDICLCCKEKAKLTIDHIVPLSRGGSDSIDNLQPLCHQCNSRKRTKTIDYRPKLNDI